MCRDSGGFRMLTEMATRDSAAAARTPVWSQALTCSVGTAGSSSRLVAYAVLAAIKGVHTLIFASVAAGASCSLCWMGCAKDPVGGAASRWAWCWPRRPCLQVK